jgi:hypothetical protein
MFKIPKWVIVRIDQIKKKILWVGVAFSPTRKYYLVKWPAICRAKEFGGWDILNLEHINYALMCKWG